MPLLTQNSELKPHRIFNFSIPAWYTKIDGKTFKTCPNAGGCAQVCYARNGTYQFKNVAAAHHRNLMLSLNDPDGFRAAINEELSHKKFAPNNVPRKFPEYITDAINDEWLTNWLNTGGVAVRIHDAGDFYSEQYLHLWFSIAASNLNVLFYAYTKEVALLKANTDKAPHNFRWIYSTGGLQDHLIDEDDRRADVFTNEQSIIDAGYMSQDESDLYAILLPTNFVGIPANNIPKFNKKLSGRRFSELGKQ
jgi:hypothetical protein